MDDEKGDGKRRKKLLDAKIQENATKIIINKSHGTENCILDHSIEAQEQSKVTDCGGSQRKWLPYGVVGCRTPEGSEGPCGVLGTCG